MKKFGLFVIILAIFLFPLSLKAFFYNWTERQPIADTPFGWRMVASDSTGTNLIGLGNNNVYISNDSGATWTERQPGGSSHDWFSAASDADGTNLIVGGNVGRLYTSSNGGANWTERQPAGNVNGNWSVASDATGTNLVASNYGGRLYTSSNGGANWTERQPAGNTDQSWAGVASDSDGTNLIAASNFARLYTSSDSGANWTERQPAGDVNKGWFAVASDSDGTNLIVSAQFGRLYTSSDSGANWTERQPDGNSDQNWNSVASDSTGTNLIVADYNKLSISPDGGSTWYENQPTPGNTWTSGAIDSDGTNVVAAPGSGYLYTGIPDTVSPTVSSFSPVDNATEVVATSDLVITFDELVNVGIGNIVIKKTADDSTFETIDVTTGNVTGGGTNTITINPTGTLAPNTGYYIQIDATAFTDLSANPYAGIADTTTWNFTTDSVSPTLSSFSPTDNSTGVVTTSNLVLTFSEPVNKGTGNIVIKRTSDDSTFETIDVTTGSVTGSGTDTITVNPTAELDSLIGYYIQIDATAFTDLSANPYAGIADTTTWNFTTGDFTNPTISSFSPTDDATSVALSTNFVLTFDEAVNVGTGNITIKRAGDNFVFEAIDVTSGNVTGDGTNTITVNPTGTLDQLTNYYVQIDATAFTDLSTNPYAGIADTTTWNFTTGDFTSPTLDSFFPVDSATGVGINHNLLLTFSESVNVGSGDVVIKKIADDSIFESIDVTSGNVTGGGTNIIEINPTGTLAPATGYYVQIDATAFTDLSSNPYAGIADITTWNFTTKNAFSGTQTLYGIDGSGSNPDAPHLFTLNATTGSKLTDIGPVGFNVTGMAFHPASGILYGTTGGSDPTGGHPQSLVQINTTTGAGTWLGIIKDGGNHSMNFPDISFRSDGRLYGFSKFDSKLYTIDITSCNGTSDTNCLATKVGDTAIGGSGFGIAFDSANNLYFFSNSDNGYYQIDPDTSDMLFSPDFSNPFGYNLVAAAFDGSSTLYASRMGFSDLVTVDISSDNSITSLGNTADMEYMDAIAFLVVPNQSHSHLLTVTTFSSDGSITVTRGGVTTVTAPPYVKKELPQEEEIPVVKKIPLPPAHPIYNFANILVKLGTKGQVCETWQNFLNDHGAHLVVDGQCGKLTIAAAKLWQASVGLKADGILGPLSRAKARQ
jgi:photosystem II stability/assembly factor-like uncharacterized protein/methionine-rich copper-binding protein CopC